MSSPPSPGLPGPPSAPAPAGPGHHTDTLIGGSFIVVWSTGYLAGAVAVAHGGPFTMLVLRFGFSALVFGLLMLAARVAWPGREAVRHSAVVGVLTMAVQFGGVYAAMYLGASPGLSALVIGTMPLTVAALAWLLGERIQPRQWLGLVLGLAGVLLVIGERLLQARATLAACAALVVGLLGISAGTLYQKRHAFGGDLRAGLFVQNAAGALVLLPLAWGLEHFRLEPGWPLYGSIAWLVLVNSVLGFALLFLLIRHGAATQVASLFYLVPAVGALMGHFALGETLSALEVAGFALAALGVWLGSRSPD